MPLDVVAADPVTAVPVPVDPVVPLDVPVAPVVPVLPVVPAPVVPVSLALPLPALLAPEPLVVSVQAASRPSTAAPVSAILMQLMIFSSIAAETVTDAWTGRVFQSARSFHTQPD